MSVSVDISTPKYEIWHYLSDILVVELFCDFKSERPEIAELLSVAKSIFLQKILMHANFLVFTFQSKF